MSTMNDDDVVRLLKSLPQHRASPGFTDHVLARLARSRDGRGPTRWRLAVVGIAVLLGVWLTYGEMRERVERRRAAERLESMQQEYRALQMELEQLRALAADVEPVIDLGGTDQVDFVFDLRRLAEERGGARSQPASHAPR